MRSNALLLPETSSVAKRQRMLEEYHRQAAPLVKLLAELESQRPVFIVVDDDGRQSFQRGRELPPGLEAVRKNTLALLDILAGNLAASGASMAGQQAMKHAADAYLVSRYQRPPADEDGEPER